MKSSVKQAFVMPILVLTVICIVISGALAATNMVTEPIITEADAVRAEAARKEVLPAAEGFTQVTAEGGPASVTEIYKADNGAGFVFTVMTTGYGGDIKIICGIDADGLITATKMLQHAETQGMGSKCAEEPYSSQYVGKGSSLEGIDAISGATVTSTAYIGAIRDVFAAYEIVKGA